MAVCRAARLGAASCVERRLQGVWCTLVWDRNVLNVTKSKTKSVRARARVAGPPRVRAMPRARACSYRLLYRVRAPSYYHEVHSNIDNSPQFTK